ncbi:recombinase family protein [Sediminimonas qiaohouensis]|uniref:recombinase family protein n=1 Tax=Sediminimonas qiaohouensis TaxID=552061 RepID=UPI00042650B2|nr:recombinase family protein [Sediminimonas qiaohouensis]
MSRSKAGGDGRMQDLKRLAVGYARVSTAGQGDSGISLDAQRHVIEEFAEAAGYKLIQVFEDVSSGVGAKSFDKRPGLTSALDLASRSNADLLVWDWDRLSRHAGFEKQIRRALKDDNQVICVREGTKLRDASRAATFVHAEKVAAEISRTTKKSMDKMRAEGVVFGNPAIRTDVQPLGTATWSHAADHRVRAIADVLRELDDPYGGTYAQVAEILNDRGSRTLQGRKWTASRARKPVTKARELLRKEEEDALQSRPDYGLF